MGREHSQVIRLQEGSRQPWRHIELPFQAFCGDSLGHATEQSLAVRTGKMRETLTIQDLSLPGLQT